MQKNDTSLSRLLRVAKRIGGPIVVRVEAGEELVVLPLDVFDRLFSERSTVYPWENNAMTMGESGHGGHEAHVCEDCVEEDFFQRDTESAETGVPFGSDETAPSFFDGRNMDVEWNFPESERINPVEARDSFEPAEVSGWEEEPVTDEPVFYEEQL